jgi:hypothetical protein
MGRTMRDRLLGLALLACALASRDAGGQAGPSDAFVGTWLFPAGAAITAQCGDTKVPVEVGGDTVAIRAVDPSTVAFELGCHCAIVLAVDGSVAHLVGAPQPCEVVVSGNTVHSSVNTLNLSLSGSDALTLDIGSNDTQVLYPPGTLECDRTTSRETLTRKSRHALACGPDDRAVGVLPYVPEGTTDCYLMAGTEGVRISMQQEIDTVCTYESGSGGEGPWVLPQSTRPAITCVPRDTARSADPQYNDLPFGRIDGNLFKPLTRDPNDDANFYAVLNLGVGRDGKPAPCPDGATLIKRVMQNEEDAGGGNTSGGRLGANVVESKLGGAPINATILFFCYFRAASAGQEIMSEFPDLGFSYAVFHAFNGPQPSWVMLKRWAYSNDESNDNQDLPHVSDDPTALAAFESVIETPTNGTTFNMARVR